MQVNINANHVAQMLNADVINLDRVAELSEGDRAKLVSDLTGHLQMWANALAAQSQAIGDAKRSALAQETSSLAATLAGKAPVEDKKAEIGKYLATLKTTFGNVADVLLSAVKIAHIFGLG